MKHDMFYPMAVFVVTALIAAVLGFSGITGPAAIVAWVIFVAGLTAAIGFFLRGSR